MGPHPWDGLWTGELGVLSKICSPFYSPTQPECQPNGKCRLTGLNEVTPSLRAGRAPGVETQPHYWSWTDPDCTGKDEAPEHLQHIDAISLHGRTGQRKFLIKGRRESKPSRICFAIKQSRVKGSQQVFGGCTPQSTSQIVNSLHLVTWK